MVTDISIDFIHPTLVVVPVMQCDTNTRIIRAKMFADGDYYSPSADFGANYGFRVDYIKMANGIKGRYEKMPDDETNAVELVIGGVSNDSPDAPSYLFIRLAPQVLTTEGKVILNICIYNNDTLQTLRSFPIVLDVYAAAITDDAPDEEYWNIKSLADVTAALEEMQTDIAKCSDTETVNKMLASTNRFFGSQAGFVAPYSAVDRKKVAVEVSGNVMTVTLPRYWFTAYFGADLALSEAVVTLDAIRSVEMAASTYLVYDFSAKNFSAMTRTQINALTTPHYICLHNRAGNPVGAFTAFLQANTADEHGTELFALAAQVGFVGNYNQSNKVSFAASGTSVTVTLPQYLYTCYVNGSGLHAARHDGTAGDTVTVANGDWLIYDFTDKAFYSKTLAQLQAYTNPYFICLHNRGGLLCGAWAALQQEERLSALEAERDADPLRMPDYYADYMANKAATVNRRASAAGLHGESFAFATDIHWPRNQGHSPALLHYLHLHTPIHRLLLCGDYYDAETTQAAALQRISDVLGLYRLSGMRVYHASGNHEYNNPTGASDAASVAKQLTEAQVYSQIMCMEQITADSASCSFFFDAPTQKVRYIVSSCTYDTKVNPDSLAWVLAQLAEVPSGYSVVLASHCGADSKASGGWNDVLSRAAAALNAKGTITYSGTAYDYSGTDARCIAILTGNKHQDRVWSNQGVLSIMTTCDIPSASDGYTRTAGTVTEQAFDVVTADLADGTLYLTRIGAGYDRIVHTAVLDASGGLQLTAESSGNLSWTSDDESVATVSGGAVTAVGAGECIVCATDEEGAVKEFWALEVSV